MSLHHCTDADCCDFGRPSARHCGCHKSDLQVLGSASAKVLTWWDAKLANELSSNADFPWAEEAEWNEFNELRRVLREIYSWQEARRAEMSSAALPTVTTAAARPDPIGALLAKLAAGAVLDCNEQIDASRFGILTHGRRVGPSSVAVGFTAREFFTLTGDL